MMSFRRSLSITSAALVVRSSESPALILPKSPMEQGQIIIVSYRAEPDAIVVRILIHLIHLWLALFFAFACFIVDPCTNELASVLFSWRYILYNVECTQESIETAKI